MNFLTHKGVHRKIVGGWLDKTLPFLSLHTTTLTTYYYSLSPYYYSYY